MYIMDVIPLSPREGGRSEASSVPFCTLQMVNSEKKVFKRKEKEEKEKKAS